MKKNIITILISILLVSCAENNSSDKKTNTTNKTNIINMKIGETYIVNEGDKLDKTSNDALVSIIEDIKTKIKTVTLTQGSATITRYNKPFSLR